MSINEAPDDIILYISTLDAYNISNLLLFKKVIRASDASQSFFPHDISNRCLDKTSNTQVYVGPGCSTKNLSGKLAVITESREL